MHFDVLTIFPEFFNPFWEHGVIRRAIERKIISSSVTNIRDFTVDKHHTTDDRPYGGGCGMVMKPEPLAKAIRSVRRKHPTAKTILLTPQGRVFNQKLAAEYCGNNALALVCGRYEGIDERIVEELIDDEISVGDYILTGGEVAAMLVMDVVTRLIPGVLGGVDSAQKESFCDDLLEHAHYTRPHIFEDHEVPAVLLSGNHREIEKWRFEASLIRTFLKRKDLLESRPLNKRETDILKKWCQDIEKIIQAQSLSGADPLSSRQ